MAPQTLNTDAIVVAHVASKSHQELLETSIAKFIDICTSRKLQDESYLHPYASLQIMADGTQLDVYLGRDTMPIFARRGTSSIAYCGGGYCRRGGAISDAICASCVPLP